MATVKSLTAKRTIPQELVDVVTGRRIIFTPSSGEGTSAALNFKMEGVNRIELTEVEENAFWKWAKPIFSRADGLSEVKEINRKIKEVIENLEE